MEPKKQIPEIVQEAFKLENLLKIYSEPINIKSVLNISSVTVSQTSQYL